MAKQLMPRAELEPRSTDMPLSPAECLRLSLFAAAKKKPNLERFPGAVVLRSFRKGEVICRQGEAAWTSFYLLTSEDVLELLCSRLATAGDMPSRELLANKVEACLQRVKFFKEMPDDRELRLTASVHLAMATTQSPRPAHWLQRLFGKRRPSSAEAPRYIPFDGPTDIAYDRLQASLYEGEVFGEMSCLYQTPRSATVRATRDCLVLELLSNVFDQLQKDPGFRSRMDALYRERVLRLQLRELSLFSSLSEEALAAVRDDIELLTCEPGQLLWDEHDRPDAVVIVRSGLVRVQTSISSLLGAPDVVDWNSLCFALRTGSRLSDGPRAAVWQRLPATARAAALHATPERLAAQQQAHLLDGLNQLIKNRRFAGLGAFRGIRARPSFRKEVKPLLQKRKSWSEQNARLFNRLLLQATFPGLLRDVATLGEGRTTTYCSRGDLLGEFELLMDQPREATCTAYGQRVELLRLSAALFSRLLDSSPELRDQLHGEATRHERRRPEPQPARGWEEATPSIFSPEAEVMGLVQGQKLMLVDLDSCTRCDECVRACADSHADGHTRLFLDGPRYGKFLVPTTCRSCLDPLCLIGCPVGSIHRGDSGEIAVENWCIGCGHCSRQCPYGAIQMHDLGVIPEMARGWRLAPAAKAEPEWTKLAGRTRDWQEGSTPFRLTDEFERSIQRTDKSQEGVPEYCFRFEFAREVEQLGPGRQYRLEVGTFAGSVRVWMNGREVGPTETRGAKREFWLLPSQLGRRNVLAIQTGAEPGQHRDKELLRVRLDEVRRPEGAEEYMEMLVTNRAVVCDMCCSVPGQVPACINACPHDAVQRLDGRFELPLLPFGSGRAM